MTPRSKAVVLSLALATGAVSAQVDDPRRLSFPPLPPLEIPKPEAADAAQTSSGL